MVGDKVLGWNYVFYLSSGMYYLGLILFLTLADSTPQKWAMATFEEIPDTFQNTNQTQSSSPA